ncbi:MAG: glycosyltransferase family 4 protein [Aquihabitans sp.]
MLRRVRDLRAGFGLVAALRTIPPGTPVHLDLPTWATSLAVRLIARRHEVFITWHTPMSVPSPLRRSWLLAKHRWVGRSRRVHILGATATARSDASIWFGRPLEAIPIVIAGYDRLEIDRAATIPSVDIERWGLSPEIPTVVGVGVLTERKGVDVALRAVAHLRSRDVPVQLLWIGGGPDGPGLDCLRRELGLETSTALVRPGDLHPNRLQMLSLIGAASVYVQPSRVDGMPLAAIEALASSVPTVVTPVGAMGELIDPTGDGSHEAVIVVPVDDVEALADAVALVLGDPIRARRMQLMAPRRVVDMEMGPVVRDLFKRYAAANRRRT